MRFSGHADGTLDQKNRIALPSKFRLQYGGPLVFTSSSTDKCVAAYAKPDFDEAVADLRAAIADEPSRMRHRVFSSRAEELSYDGQGRLVLPTHLVERADLRAGAEAGGSPVPIVFLGVDDRLEIWSKQLWDEAEARYG